FAEARRVLRPGGTLLFNVWDRIEANDFAHIVDATLATLFPDDPPRFLARVPHGWSDRDAIVRDLAEAGFVHEPAVHAMAARSPAPSARAAAMAYCQGTPLRNELEARRRLTVQEATDACADAIARRFGDGPVEGWVQGFVVTALR
ncbi:MAG TPA: SAM-dependent methyltransferase, partial [Albitalea sp.]